MNINHAGRFQGAESLCVCVFFQFLFALLCKKDLFFWLKWESHIEAYANHS